jgi:phosphoglycolate phosphatase-like HAD superfamily hydrolase
MGRFIGSRIPEPWQPELDRLWHELTLIWDGYVRGQITLGIVMGVLTWLAMSVLGERNAPAMGLVFFLGEFVPGVGHVIAGVVAVTIALFLGSTWLPLMHLWFAVVIAATYVVLAQLENLYMRPRIIGRRVALHPVVIIVGAVAGARIGGVLGIVLAAPTIASARLLLGYGLRKVLDEEPFPLPSARLSEQDLHWRSLVRERAMAALIFDLDGTLAATDGCLVMQLASRLRHLQAWLPGFRAEPAARFLLSARDWLIHRLDPLLRGLLPSEALTGSHGWLQQAGVDGDLEEALPVAGSVEELSLLAQHYPLALVTDRTNHEVAAFLARAGLTGLFGAIITRNELHALPPHPAEIDMAARRLGVAAGSCVVVGDAPADLRAARAAGAMAIGVLTGFGGSEEMAPADLVIPSVACLHDYLPLSQRAGFGGPYAPPGLEIGSRAACRVPKR